MIGSLFAISACLARSDTPLHVQQSPENPQNVVLIHEIFISKYGSPDLHFISAISQEEIVNSARSNIASAIDIKGNFEILESHFLCWSRFQDNRPWFWDYGLCWLKIKSIDNIKYVILEMARNPISNLGTSHHWRLRQQRLFVPSQSISKFDMLAQPYVEKVGVLIKSTPPTNYDIVKQFPNHFEKVPTHSDTAKYDTYFDSGCWEFLIGQSPPRAF